MNIGSKVNFYYVDMAGRTKCKTIFLSSAYQRKLSDEEVVARLDKS